MIGSPQQLAEVLFVKLGLSRKRRGKTGFSTDARVLQAIRDEHAIIPKIERWRELTKLVQTYLDALPALRSATTAACTRRSCRPTPPPAACPRSTRTCRTSRSAPRPGREIRACFVAEPGNVLLSVDYSQVELRVLAHIAGEEVLRDIFQRGEDVHTETAVAVFDAAAGAARRRHALEGQDGQLRDRLRPVAPTGSPTGCRSRRRRRRSSSTATSSASRPSRSS